RALSPLLWSGTQLKVTNLAPLLLGCGFSAYQNFQPPLSLFANNELLRVLVIFEIPKQILSLCWSGRKRKTTRRLGEPAPVCPSPPRGPATSSHSSVSPGGAGTNPPRTRPALAQLVPRPRLPGAQPSSVARRAPAPPRPAPARPGCAPRRRRRRAIRERGGGGGGRPGPGTGCPRRTAPTKVSFVPQGTTWLYGPQQRPRQTAGSRPGARPPPGPPEGSPGDRAGRESPRAPSTRERGVAASLRGGRAREGAGPREGGAGLREGRGSREGFRGRGSGRGRARGRGSGGGAPGGAGPGRGGAPGEGLQEGAVPGVRAAGLPGVPARRASPGAVGRGVPGTSGRGGGAGGGRAPRSGGGAGAGAGAGLRAAGAARGGARRGEGRGGSGGRPGMASMAAAIAASRSAVMSGNRPLDDRERKRFTYFSSLSPMARKIMQDKEKIREKYGPEWARLPPAQQDEIIDRCLVGPGAPAPRGPGDPGDSEELARFPGLRGPTGQKVVRFGDEDITWQDEHSAPFSWETRSQMEFSVCSLSIQEPGSGMASEPRQLSKACQGSQALRPSQGSKSSSLDALGPARKEEEASFWKINAERSRGEGPEAEFQSLTPSQIKSMEKGEKVLPACYRQDPALKDREAKGERPSNLRQEQRVLPCTSIEPERAQPVPACTSTVKEATLSEPGGKLPSPEDRREDLEDVEDALFSEPMPTQVTSSNVVLKTGFDFLDNW
uniref:DUF4706 domain-containing protein n=2 Tax=Canis lupus TaxID=9612 RepID=A0A8I3MIW3_CANLF